MRKIKVKEGGRVILDNLIVRKCDGEVAGYVTGNAHYLIEIIKEIKIC